MYHPSLLWFPCFIASHILIDMSQQLSDFEKFLRSPSTNSLTRVQCSKQQKKRVGCVIADCKLREGNRQALRLTARRGQRVSVIRDLRYLSGHGPGLPVLDGPA